MSLKPPRRVLFISYEFPPSLEIGAQASFQIVRYLPLYDWEPVVLTVQERYYSNRDYHLQRAFAGQVIRTWAFHHPLEIFTRLKSRLHFDQSDRFVQELTPAEWSGEGIGTARRWVLSLLKTPDLYTGWIAPAVIAGLREIRRQRVDHLCSSAPYWSNHLIGLILSYVTELTWTAHFRDPWTGIPQWKPVSAVSTRIEQALERMVVSRANSVVCVTHLHAHLLRQTYPGLSPDRFITIPNGFDEEEWKKIDRGLDKAATKVQRTFVIRYAGSLYQRRNPLPLFRAVQTLIDSYALDRETILIELIGWCDLAEGRSVMHMTEKCGIADRVKFTGPLARADTLRRMAQADLLLLLAEAQPYQIPGKAYEYLRAGRPILALTSEGALAQLLYEASAEPGSWIRETIKALPTPFGRHMGTGEGDRINQQRIGRWLRLSIVAC